MMQSIVNTAYFLYDNKQISAFCTIYKGDMIRMACCNIYNLNATEISSRNDVTTITVGTDALQGIIPRCDCPRVNICINTSFEIERLCTRIEVTDGTSTLCIYKCNQYWRPKHLICNSVICTIYKPDPQLLVFEGGK